MAATAPTFAEPVSEQAFPVHFSNPNPLLRFAPQPVTHWKFFGSGELLFKANSVVLRGRRPRPLGFTEQSLEIPLADIFNVGWLGKTVQLHVRIPLAAEKLLELWVDDEESARRIAQLLPDERTPEFARWMGQREAFKQAFEGVGTRMVVTPGLVALTVLVFGWAVYAGAGWLTPNVATLVRLGSNFGPFTLDGQWWRLLSSLFLHFGLVPLLINMGALWQMGRVAERLYGSLHFLLLYVFAGLCGGITGLLWNPTANSAGASGAIFGVLGGLLVFIFRPDSRIPAEVATRARISGAVFILYNLAHAFTHSGVHNSAHLGGLLGGIVMGWLLARPLSVEGRAEATFRLAVAVSGSAIALAAVSLPLLLPGTLKSAEWHFRHQLQLDVWDERRAQAAQSIVDQLQIERLITRVEWGERLAREVLPEWEAAEGRFKSVRFPTQSESAQLEARIVAYLQARRQALTLMSEAARNDDPAKMTLAKTLLAKNRREQFELARHLPPVY
jgi:rhomboid protease GluP